MKKNLRSFGIMWGVIALAFALYFAYRMHWPALAASGAIALLFLACAWLAPQYLGWLYRPWMKLADLLAGVMTRVLLTVFYLAAITPYALFLRLFRDRLQQKLDRQATSYWQAPPDKKTDFDKPY